MFKRIKQLISNETLLKYLKSRTIWFAILLGILPIFAKYVGLLGLSDTGEMILVQVIGFFVAVLRVLTTVPISDK